MSDNTVNGVVITFFSTASAVGKTLIGSNMASELARAGRSVCLVDCDLQFGDVCNYLKLIPERTLFDVQKTYSELGTSVAIEDFLTPYEHDGVVFYVLAAPKRLAEAYNMNTDYVVQAVKELQKRFEYVLIDTTSMFSALNLAMLDLSTIVTFLGIVDFIPTIKNMKIGVDTLKNLNYDKNKIRLVLNRSNSRTRISIDDVEKLLGEEFYHILPNDFMAASRSIKEGVPLVLTSDNTALGAALRDLVARYTNKVYDMPETNEGNLGGFFSRIFG